VTVLVTVPAAVVIASAAPMLCVWAFGDEFRGSIDDLRILTVGAVGIAALKLLGNALTAQRRPTLESAAIATAFAVTIALDVALIPSHGGLGAAVASAAAYTAGGVAVALMFARAFGMRAGSLVPARRDAASLWQRVRGVDVRARPSPSSR
jgi:O-antigen/teichoic acid export membrane protein